MKTEYLNRTVTINRDSLEQAVNDLGLELVHALNAGITDTILGALATKLTRRKIVRILFGDRDEAVTIRGEDFAAKEMEVLRELYDGGVLSAEAQDAGHDPVYNLCGRTVELLLHLEDKLFGSDHVEEHEAEGKEKEETDG